MAKARDLYIRDTRASVAQNLEEAGLLVQRVYLVDKNALVKVVKGTRRRSHECIDEEDLLRDLFALADSNGGSQAVEDAS
ncbi:uncharacterized protein B0H18DRAFT_1033909 [Fomitopsis serialis]|uniref:uncharacterized protein n=1 Tax=Fomitopsis serialis TaxID=139415 RepID=UPI002007D285|nr:uncharacterized protein B0H18DRAFT_1033909 [Neoantrodia serialis]KAH9917605.1 hypothetical protein B0H18DRAFT_1033909 [Neoantrodia serialis]